MDRAADSGPYDPSSIPFGEKKENNKKHGLGWVGPEKKNFQMSKARSLKNVSFSI